MLSEVEGAPNGFVVEDEEVRVELEVMDEL